MSTQLPTEKKVGHDWERWYRALRAADPDAYNKALSYSGALSINYRHSLEQAAEIERNFVMFACELLAVTP